MSDTNTNDQITALNSIVISMALRGLPKLVRTMVPPMGVNISGVRKAIPLIPYFFQMVTNLRVLGEKTLFLLKNLLSTLSLK